MWINPIGGLGDVLMLSGVLEQIFARDARRRFRMIRRPRYMCLLEGHPAIEAVGFPRVGDEIQRVDYWSDPDFQAGRLRPMQVLARLLGLKCQVEERFFVADDDGEDDLIRFIPWRAPAVAIAPGSVSPRKQWGWDSWRKLVEQMRSDGYFVLQLGGREVPHVPGAYSIAGATTPKQALRVLRNVDAIVTIDSFFLHAAHHVSCPTAVIWGPTRPEVYGYPEQIHLRADVGCPHESDCIAAGKGLEYVAPCPRQAPTCTDHISADQVLAAVRLLLDTRDRKDGSQR